MVQGLDRDNLFALTSQRAPGGCMAGALEGKGWLHGWSLARQRDGGVQNHLLEPLSIFSGEESALDLTPDLGSPVQHN